MTELYLEKNPFQSSNVDSKVDTSVNNSEIRNVEAIGDASETLGVENPNSADILGKSDLIPPADDNPGVGASIKATIDC
ncbi:hypothetical protein A2U01_0074857, partial [Trifolium medium]|nr:hypothetical protein [Trifolium medium]